MSGQRQKNRPEQGELAFPTGSRSEAPKTDGKGTETLVAKRKPESLAETERLMEEVCEWENCKQALQRVKANKGSPGVDGMTVEELPDYLKQQGPEIGEQLRNGTYQPQPVRRVKIPKPDGGVRNLGIPSALDRFVQQAVLQVLQKRWDPTLSEHSHGFRPGHSARQAVREAQQYIAEGHRWVVDRLGEIFRSSESRSPVRGGSRARGRQANAQVDSGVSEGRCDGRSSLRGICRQSWQFWSRRPCTRAIRSNT